MRNEYGVIVYMLDFLVLVDWVVLEEDIFLSFFIKFDFKWIRDFGEIFIL